MREWNHENITDCLGKGEQLYLISDAMFMNDIQVHIKKIDEKALKVIPWASAYVTSKTFEKWQTWLHSSHGQWRHKSSHYFRAHISSLSASVPTNTSTPKYLHLTHKERETIYLIRFTLFKKTTRECQKWSHFNLLFYRLRWPFYPKTSSRDFFTIGWLLYKKYTILILDRTSSSQRR